MREVHRESERLDRDFMNEARTPTTALPYNILPPLTTQEFEALRSSIELEGIRDPIVVDENGNVLDGVHRLKIKPDAPRRTITGLTHNEKQAFVFQVNFTRRNLSPDQKKTARRRMKDVAFALRKEDPHKNTQERVAALLGIARNTISDWFRQDGVKQNRPTAEAESMHNVDSDDMHTPAPPPPDARVKIPPAQWPIILERAESGETQEQIAADYGVNQTQISRIVNKEREQNEAAESRAQSAVHLEDSGIHVGDFRAAGNIVQDASVDLIFTDPPYADALVYTNLAQFAGRVLRSGGWCLAYCGIAHLPEVLSGMSNHLTYGWVFIVQHTGGDLRFRKFRLQNKWKPIVGFFKPPLSVWWEWFADLTSGGREKQEHSWQQAIEEARHFIRALSPKGGLICDPFAGSGTTCLAAKELDRQWIAFEQDEGTALKARSRLND